MRSIENGDRPIFGIIDFCDRGTVRIRRPNAVPVGVVGVFRPVLQRIDGR